MDPIEGEHTTRTVDGRTYEYWPLYFVTSWEVRDVATDTLLTSDESLDDEPTDDDLRVLAEEAGFAG